MKFPSLKFVLVASLLSAVVLVQEDKNNWHVDVIPLFTPGFLR